MYLLLIKNCQLFHSFNILYEFVILLKQQGHFIIKLSLLLNHLIIKLYPSDKFWLFTIAHFTFDISIVLPFFVLATFGVFLSVFFCTLNNITLFCKYTKIFDKLFKSLNFFFFFHFVIFFQGIIY